MIRWLIERQRESRRRKQLYEQVVSEVLRLPPRQAKGLFREISEFFGNEFWIKSDDNGDFEKIKHLLPRNLIDYFEAYPSVGFNFFGLIISRNFITYSDIHSESLCIGEDGFVGEVVITPEKEEVYLLYSDDLYIETSEYFKDGARSIYNFIINRLCIDDRIYEYVRSKLEMDGVQPPFN